MISRIRGRWLSKLIVIVLLLVALVQIVSLLRSMVLQSQDCYIEDLDPECFNAAMRVQGRRNSSRKSSFKGSHKIKETALQMKEILTKLKAQATVLNHMRELKQLEERTEFLLSLYENPREEVKTKDAPDGEESPTLVCPETYLGSTKGYPFFYTGFAITNCTSAKPFESVLSILINYMENRVNLQTILDGISLTYPNITVHIATTKEKHFRLHSKFLNLQIHMFEENDSPVKAWNSLFMNASTPFVLVARDMINFTWDVRLERLVREAQAQNMDFVGGATRNEHGYWDFGCYQTTNRNYSLDYTLGYYYSEHECVYCSYLGGPFVAKTEAIQYLRLKYDVSEKLAFEDLFFRFTHKHQSHSLLCPDAMFYVKNTLSRISDEMVWKEFSKRYDIDRVKLPTGKVVDLCPYSQCNKDSQRSLSRCCMQKLSDLIKDLMKDCEEQGLMCELQEGSLLGAVKFGGILPWERDADITFHTQNYSALEKLKSKMKKHGYSLNKAREPWCCVDGVTAGGIATILGQDWHVEMYGQHLMDSEKLKNNGLPPTKLQLDGQWVSVPHNPGLYVRNRYGKEIYRHAIHWMSTGMNSGWATYDTRAFPPCSTPGHHSCLDQYSSDGNIQFRDGH